MTVLLHVALLVDTCDYWLRPSETL